MAHTGWNNLGIVPWFSDAALLPAEDALEISGGGDGPLKIAVPDAVAHRQFRRSRSAESWSRA